MEWHGAGCDVMGCGGVGWGGPARDGMGWDGMGWDGSVLSCYYKLFLSCYCSEIEERVRHFHLELLEGLHGMNERGVGGTGPAGTRWARTWCCSCAVLVLQGCGHLG